MSLDNLLHLVGSQVQAGGAGAQQAPGGHQVHQGILEDFRIHFKRGNPAGASQDLHHTVGDIADPGLQRQKILGNPSGAHFVGQKSRHMGADRPAGIIGRAEGSDIVRLIVFHHPDHLLGVHHRIRHPDPGEGFENRDRIALPGRRHHHDVIHLPEPGTLIPVDFDHHFLRIFQIGGRGPDGGG